MRISDWSSDVCSSDLRPTSVLFVCTHNSIRSPMAEAILKHFHKHRIFVDSVGVRAGELDPFAVAVMEENGIDLSRNCVKTLDDLEIGRASCRDIVYQFV